MNIFKKALTDLKACKEAVEYFKENKLEGKELKTCIRKALNDKHGNWCTWLIPRLMTHEQQIMYTIFAAELVIHIYEKEYPLDGRLREAIEAARTYQKNPTENNRSAAKVAAENAWSAAQNAQGAARSAAWSAAWSVESAVERAARSAESAAESAAENAARSAESAAESAAENAARSAICSVESAVERTIQIKIINYGLKILEDSVR